MEIKMKIKEQREGPRLEEVSAQYFESLFKRYGLAGNFSVEYEPVKDSRDRGMVIIKGEGFDVSLVYSLLSRNFIIIINGETLEDKLGEK